MLHPGIRALIVPSILLLAGKAVFWRTRNSLVHCLARMLCRRTRPSSTGREPVFGKVFEVFYESTTRVGRIGRAAEMHPVVRNLLAPTLRIEGTLPLLQCPPWPKRGGRHWFSCIRKKVVLHQTFRAQGWMAECVSLYMHSSLLTVDGSESIPMIRGLAADTHTNYSKEIRHPPFVLCTVLLLPAL